LFKNWKSAERHIYNEKLGCNGAETIASALQLAETLKVPLPLTKLFPYDCNIGSRGAKALACTLRINKTLRILDIARNHIDNDGARALADAMKANTILSQFLTRPRNTARCQWPNQPCDGSSQLDPGHGAVRFFALDEVGWCFCLLSFGTEI
jgi:hypothetical protein